MIRYFCISSIDHEPCSNSLLADVCSSDDFFTRGEEISRKLVLSSNSLPVDVCSIEELPFYHFQY